MRRPEHKTMVRGATRAGRKCFQHLLPLLLGLALFSGCTTTRAPRLAGRTGADASMRSLYPGWEPRRHPKSPPAVDLSKPAPRKSQKTPAPDPAEDPRLPAPVIDQTPPREVQGPPADRMDFVIVPENARLSATQQVLYKIRKGDTLNSIAEKFYGDSRQWRRIYDANRQQLPNPDKISPGLVLKIP